MEFEKARTNIGMAVHVKHSSGQNRNAIIHSTEDGYYGQYICLQLPTGFYLNSRKPEDVFEGHATENLYQERQ